MRCVCSDDIPEGDNHSRPSLPLSDVSDFFPTGFGLSMSWSAAAGGSTMVVDASAAARGLRSGQ